MHALKNWQARRAGPTITVTGKDASNNEEAKLTGVTLIEPRNYGARIVAVQKDGTETELTP